MNNTVNPMALMAMAPATGQNKSTNGKSSSWYESMAQAWGETLDKQANRIESLSDTLQEGDDRPATITAISTESLRMSFMSTASHTAISSTGEALKAMAQKN